MPILSRSPHSIFYVAEVKSRRRPSLHSTARLAGLCFVGGFVDVVGFTSVLGVFVGHVTSNLSLAGSAVVHPDRNFVEKLVILPIFIAAVALATLMNHWARLRQFNPERILLAFEAACLVAFMIFGAALQTRQGNSQSSLVGVAALGVLAMGVHNAATREARQLPSTTAMTANLTQFIMDVTDLCVAAPHRKALTLHARRGGTVLGTFVIGAVAGTCIFLRWQFFSLTIPIAALVILTITPPAYSGIPVARRGKPAPSED